MKNRSKFALVLTALLLLSVIGHFVIPPVYTAYTHPVAYLDEVKSASETHGVPIEVILAVIKNESGFRADAVSGAGAIGLMQMMPRTFSDLCSKRGVDDDTPELLTVPKISIDFGTYYLARLYKRFGDWETVFAAYNAGQGKVAAWLKNEEYAKDGKLYYIPIDETRDFVARVKKSVFIYEERLESSRVEGA